MDIENIVSKIEGSIKYLTSIYNTRDSSCKLDSIEHTFDQIEIKVMRTKIPYNVSITVLLSNKVLFTLRGSKQELLNRLRVLLIKYSEHNERFT